jgi:uncharacterized membrane protein YccC
MTTSGFFASLVPALSPQTRAAIGFSMRTFVASMLALYAAFAFQLESPYWAWLTVWIVAQPTPGMVLSKALYRAIGTIAGSMIGIILIALFAQAPELFVAALALLVGGCTVLSNVLTNFRAYATVLAGYTAGIVASDAINAPDQVFYIGMARTAAILLGIAASILVTSIFARHNAEVDTRAKLLEALKDAARRAAYSWQGTNEDRIKIGRKLIFELIALNTLVEFAEAESGAFRIQGNQARNLIAHIFSLVSARRSLDAHLIRRGWPQNDGLDVFHEIILTFLHEIPAKLDEDKVDELIERIRDERAQLARLQPEKETASLDELVSERLVIDRLDDLLFHLDGALRDWRDLQRGTLEREPALVLNFHRDLRAAWIGGLRATIAVAATGAFWIAEAWDSGPGALVIVSVLMSIFAANPHPDRIGWIFFKSSLVAITAGLICKYLILPAGSEFEILAFATGIFLIPLGLVMANPATNVAGVSFSFVFLALVGPSNPMVYDLSASMNFGLATAVGILFGTLSYILIFPADPLAARRYVTYRIRRGLEFISRHDPLPATSTFWETRMYDRVIRLNDPANPSATPTDEWLDAGLGALTLGNEILRLRRWLATESLSTDVKTSTAKVVDAFRDFLHKPELAAVEVREGLDDIALDDPGAGDPHRQAWARILGALGEINFFLSRNPLLTSADKAAT